MKNTSTNKILFLLNILFNKNCTKNDIITEFKKNNIPLSKPTINKYINLLKENEIEINISQKNNKNLYQIEQEEKNLFFTPEEEQAINNIKNLIISKKDYTLIRRMIRIFLKFAKYMQDSDQKEEFLHFGYFSQINWKMVLELEKHCKEKNIISIEYILPHNEIKTITIHVDKISMSDSTEKIYLKGILKETNSFYSLPIDKILCIKNIIRRRVKFNLITDVITYIVGSDIYDEVGKDSLEVIIKKDKNYTTIKRPIENNFYIVQRLLYFCPDLYYISDENIKNQIKEKLCLMEDSYNERM